jgi:Zn-dependent protease
MPFAARPWPVALPPRWWLAGAIVATAVAWFLILMPAQMVPPNHFRMEDKVDNALMFAGVAGLWRLAGISAERVLAAGLIMAAWSELFQLGLGPEWGRDCELGDAVADACGVLCALAAVPAGLGRLVLRERAHADA